MFDLFLTLVAFFLVLDTNVRKAYLISIFVLYHLSTLLFCFIEVSLNFNDNLQYCSLVKQKLNYCDLESWQIYFGLLCSNLQFCKYLKLACFLTEGLGALCVVELSLGRVIPWPWTSSFTEVHLQLVNNYSWINVFMLINFVISWYHILFLNLWFNCRLIEEFLRQYGWQQPKSRKLSTHNNLSLLSQHRRQRV